MRVAAPTKQTPDATVRRVAVVAALRWREGRARKHPPYILSVRAAALVVSPYQASEAVRHLSDPAWCWPLRPWSARSAQDQHGRHLTHHSIFAKFCGTLHVMTTTVEELMKSAADARRVAQNALRVAVREARAADWSWDRISAALGGSPNGRRFAATSAATRSEARSPALSSPVGGLPPTSVSCWACTGAGVVSVSGDVRRSPCRHEVISHSGGGMAARWLPSRPPAQPAATVHITKRRRSSKITRCRRSPGLPPTAKKAMPLAPMPTATPFSSVRRSSRSAGGAGWRMPESRASTRASISLSTFSRNDATTASLYSGPSSSCAAAAA